MVTQSLPNACGVAGATASDYDGSCATEDLLTVDQVVHEITYNHLDDKHDPLIRHDR